jgi:hypothetical protein
LVGCATPASDDAIQKLVTALLVSKSSLASSFFIQKGEEGHVRVEPLHPPIFSALPFTASLYTYTPAVLLMRTSIVDRLISSEDVVNSGFLLEVVLRSARLTLPYTIVPDALFSKYALNEAIITHPTAMVLAQVYARANSVITQAGTGLRRAQALQKLVANPPLHRSWMTYTGTQGYWDVTYGMIELPPIVIRGPLASHFPVSIAKFLTTQTGMDNGPTVATACGQKRKDTSFTDCIIPPSLYNYTAAVYAPNADGWSAWRFIDDISAPVPYIENYILHPMVSNVYRVLPVRSWTSHIETVGSLHVHYDLPSQCGDGACLHVIVDQRPIWHICSSTGSRQTGDYRGNVTLHVGTRIDMIVDPLGNHECDRVHAQLSVEA